MKHLAPALALWVGLVAPASAAGVGFSLPKLRVLNLEGASSVGGSVQVIGGVFSVGLARLDLALDYAYTRDFARAANYSFFDAQAGVGLPLQLSPQFYLTPALDAHALAFVASSEGIDGAAFGLAPRLTLGYRPTNRISVELAASDAFLFGLVAGSKGLSGSLITVELGGTFNF